MKVPRIIRNFLYLGSVLICISGCYYDVEEDLYPSLDCATMDMSYQDDILPIISDNCYQCHDAASNFGNVTLEGHAELSSYVTGGRLLGVINHDSGFSPMPKNSSKLLDCQIEKIASWITDGAPNN